MRKSILEKSVTEQNVGDYAVFCRQKANRTFEQDIKNHAKIQINFAWQKWVESLHRRPLENCCSWAFGLGKLLTVAGLSMNYTLYPHKCDCYIFACKCCAICKFTHSLLKTVTHKTHFITLQKLFTQPANYCVVSLLYTNWRYYSSKLTFFVG